MTTSPGEDEVRLAEEPAGGVLLEVFLMFLLMLPAAGEMGEESTPPPQPQSRMPGPPPE